MNSLAKEENKSVTLIYRGAVVSKRREGHTPQRKRTGCIRCGDPVVFSSMYCWECYKYENYESR